MCMLVWLNCFVELFFAILVEGFQTEGVYREQKDENCCCGVDDLLLFGVMQ